MVERELLKQLKRDVEHICVELPSSPDFTVKELQGWMNGYAMCHQAILDLIEHMEELYEEPLPL